MTTKKAWVSAVVSGIIALLSSLSTAVQGQNVGFGTITMGQWLTAFLSFFVAFGGTGGATYRTTNAEHGNQGAEKATPGVPVG